MTPDLKTLRQTLRDLAGKATPGPWRTFMPGSLQIVDSQDEHGYEVAKVAPKTRFGTDPEAWANAGLISLANPSNVLALLNALDEAEKALEKIADPRKRDHREPDKYTEVGCLMNIADEALSKLRGGR